MILTLLNKFISLGLVFTIFLFGNMGFVHAEESGKGANAVMIHHIHEGISESHEMKTSTTEQPTCGDSDITSSVIIQNRYSQIQDTHLALKVPAVYFSDYCEITVIDTARYSQYYPGPTNESFGHFLIGEQILLI